MIRSVTLKAPRDVARGDAHHAQAAATNAAVVAEASRALLDTLSETRRFERILLEAAAGAGKSYALRKLVVDAIGHPRCSRVCLVAFTHKQTHALARPLGEELGKKKVCLFVSSKRVNEVPSAVFDAATIATTTADIPSECEVLVATCHKLGAFGEAARQLKCLGKAENGKSVYDVLFVDEAWQIPHHLFKPLSGHAPITVGVGDVGQLPPLESGTNPWRGDSGYNPFRAWPTSFDGDAQTWSKQLPAVWRPAEGHLALWRAFYPKWERLECVAAARDRGLDAPNLSGAAARIWRQVGGGVPTLLEVDGLAEPEAPDIDMPLMRVIESLLDKLFAAGFELTDTEYDASGTPKRVTSMGPDRPWSAPLVTILATRNQAFEDAADVVARLTERHSLPDGALVSSTVDSYQGQTNGMTIAAHPLSGAAELDEFNSAFGRLAVTCTRATHGLLVLSRPGLDALLGDAPVRPGTPFGEPGIRHLPRQTHQRILDTFARARATVSECGPRPSQQPLRVGTVSKS